jgi:hypothetical protein
MSPNDRAFAETEGWIWAPARSGMTSGQSRTESVQPPRPERRGGPPILGVRSTDDDRLRYSRRWSGRLAQLVVRSLGAPESLTIYALNLAFRFGPC